MKTDKERPTEINQAEMVAAVKAFTEIATPTEKWFILDWMQRALSEANPVQRKGA